ETRLAVPRTIALMPTSTSLRRIQTPTPMNEKATFPSANWELSAVDMSAMNATCGSLLERVEIGNSCVAALTTSSKDGHHVIVGSLLDFDPSLNELADLPAGMGGRTQRRCVALDQNQAQRQRCMTARTAA